MNGSKIKEIILQNRANDQFSVNQLAGEMGVSYSYLYEIVQKNFDMSPLQLIETIRLEEAVRLIASGLKQIKIYKRLGYENVRTFREAFSKRLRMNYTSCRSNLDRYEMEEKELEINRYISALWRGRDN
jgi:AraC-like DNA-binding protein